MLLLLALVPLVLGALLVASRRAARRAPHAPAVGGRLRWPSDTAR